MKGNDDDPRVPVAAVRRASEAVHSDASPVLATASASEIICDSVSVAFTNGTTAVDDVSVKIPPGKITTIVGPSGCGKTTLLRLIAGLQEPTSGSIELMPSVTSRRGEIGFVFQQPSLLPWRTTLGNVQLPLELVDTGGRDLESPTKLLAAVGLQDAADFLPGQLSGGMKMRVSIARVLVTRPSVLLLDEPFAALDEMLRTQLGKLILDLYDVRGFTAVMVTHNISEAILLSHQIIVMREGKIIAQIENPLPHPRDEDLRRTAEFGAFYGEVSDALRDGGGATREDARHD